MINSYKIHNGLGKHSSMDGVILHKEIPSKHSTMVVAFAGWPDAAEAATRAVRYLIRKLPAEKIAEIDCEEYYDFTLTRPQSRMNKHKERLIKWPESYRHVFTETAWHHLFWAFIHIFPRTPKMESYVQGITHLTGGFPGPYIPYIIN